LAENKKDYRADLLLALRFFQILTVAMVAVGFIWGAGDVVMAWLPEDSPVTPLSLMLMLYGAIGSLIIEVAVRVVKGKK